MAMKKYNTKKCFWSSISDINWLIVTDCYHGLLSLLLIADDCPV